MHFILNAALLPELVNRDANAYLAVVIDTLRFTTTATLAAASGATSIATVREIESAQALSVDSRGLNIRSPLLCGERNCNRVEGFDLGNSPLDVVPDVVQGRDLVFSTTNGTKAVASVSGASELLLAAFVNRKAVVGRISDWLAKGTGKALLVCSGTDGQITEEDVWTAGAIVELLEPALQPHQIGDAAKICFESWMALRQRLESSPVESAFADELSRTIGGANLLASGYLKDLAIAAKLDLTDCVLSRIASQEVVLESGVREIVTQFAKI